MTPLGAALSVVASCWRFLRASNPDQQGDLLTMDFMSFSLAFGWRRENGLIEGGLDDELMVSRRLADGKWLPWSAVGSGWRRVGRVSPLLVGTSVEFAVLGPGSPWREARFGEEHLWDHKPLLLNGAVLPYRERTSCLTGLLTWLRLGKSCRL
ncbi:unnamed protein product [Symbiodinium sp. CCMP2592]|nr:unnamed protein product [Symbiodinium sp. CCMP2592]